jgi:hypothetical protein
MPIIARKHVYFRKTKRLIEAFRNSFAPVNIYTIYHGI